MCWATRNSKAPLCSSAKSGCRTWQTDRAFVRSQKCPLLRHMYLHAERHQLVREGDLSLVSTHSTLLAGPLGATHQPHNVSAALSFRNAERTEPRGRVRAEIEPYSADQAKQSWWWGGCHSSVISTNVPYVLVALGLCCIIL